MAGARARFPNRVSGPINHNLYYREYKPLLKRVALDDEGFTFHAVRDTFARARFARSHEV